MSGHFPFAHPASLIDPIYGGLVQHPFATHLPGTLVRHNHELLPDGDTIISYGVDEFGQPVKITTTGVLHGEEIKTFTERIAPGEITEDNVSESVGPYGERIHTVTRNYREPFSYARETSYTPNGVSYTHHGIPEVIEENVFEPNFTSVTTSNLAEVEVPVTETTVVNEENPADNIIE